MATETLHRVSRGEQPTPPVSEAGACVHCGLPMARATSAGESCEPAFCCTGCRAAWEIIHGCGLERYYRVRDGAANGKPARGTGRHYEEFDDPKFASLYCRASPGGLLTTELFLEGVHCAACVWLVEKLPAIVPGVIESRLDFRRGLLRVTWDAGRVRLSDAARALDALGYVPHPGREAAARDARRREDRTGLVRLGVAGACAGNVMLLAFALYSGTFDAMDASYREFFRWLSMGIGVLSLAWPGRVFFRGALSALRTRTPHLDLPIAVGLAAGAVWGVVNTVRGAGEIYFDSLSVLVFVLLVGRWVQRRQQRWAADSMELLYSLTPSRARLIEEEQGRIVTREVPVEALACGATVEVRAGDSVPVDGVILEGRSAVDQALLTGESRPTTLVPGDRVAAGSVSLSGRLLVRVEATGRETRVGKLMELVEDATRRRAPIVRLTDRIAGYFVVVMLLLAGITAAVWLWIDPARAIDHATALLIVTCPCALGLATPLAVTVAIGRAARAGVLLKGGDSLQLLSRPGTLLIDKTGTVTRGEMALVRWEGDRAIMPLVGAIEAISAHPVARALSGGCSKNGRDEFDGLEVAEVPGGGMIGRVGAREVAVGSCAFIRARGVQEADWIADTEHAMAADGLTPVLVADSGRVAAIAGLGDPLRDDAAAMVAELRAAGWRVGLLSGDHPTIVKAVGLALGIEPGLIRGGATPEEKVRVVRDWMGAKPIVMVGDGVNDAAALAAADVGIAVHGGAEASLAAADVYLRDAGLGAIVSLTRASRRTLGVIHRNLAASLVYNLVAAALAMTGAINPLIAAILMPASSLTVLGLSLRQRPFGGA
ncbi:MAG: heavy metal translocating P-type ATPase [Phycisphaerales bacterium]